MKRKFKFYLCYTLINPFGIIPDLYISIRKMFQEEKKCSNCYNCRNLEHSRYCICNVQLTKEEYKKKIKGDKL